VHGTGSLRRVCLGPRAALPPAERVTRTVASVLAGLRRLVRRTLWEMTPRDHRESARDLRRRQWVAGSVVVVGSVVLALSLRIEPGNDWFYPATFGLALVWTVGAFASGPLHLGRTLHGAEPGPRPVLIPLVYGVLLAGLFIVGALVVREIPWLDDQVRHVLQHADQGSVPLLMVVTAVNGVAEELFFRGALYAATTRYAVVVTTAAYAIATLATGNVMLAVAALLLGALVGLERRATGGIQAPIITHVLWSLAMLVALPALFG
jgi:membrane protease YdiL (CAAX protease family)